MSSMSAGENDHLLPKLQYHTDLNNEVDVANNNTLLWEDKLNLPQITFRATIAGLMIGSVVLISNFQFGLQTGWVSMMSLPSALLGFTIFKISPFAKNFTDVENVYIQSIAVAVGTGPLAYGLIGIIPAIEKFLAADESGSGSKISLSLSQLITWSFGLALFGVFFAIPLRKQVIIKEKLPFPSGRATATLISVLHGSEVYEDSKSNDDTNDLIRIESPVLQPVHRSIDPEDHSNDDTYKSNINSLIYTFSISATYTLLSYFFPILKNIPLFGSIAADKYQWSFQPSPAYIGQGIIMGLPTVSYMLFGAFLGWGVLAPFAKKIGWAPGDINDWINGGQGWILWLSLSVMISDSLVSFGVVSYKSIKNVIHNMKKYDLERQARPIDLADVEENHLVSYKTTVIGLAFSSIICLISVRLVFGSIVPYYATAIAIILALLFSILGVRALGETDLNPVSGIGKLSQLVFALIIPSSHPAKILINLVAGGIAEAGAQQAGDLMQDLKTGHLIGASPKAQFVAQMIGTLYSVVLSSVMYKVYNIVYDIPNNLFRIPTAIIWIDCSRLVTGEGLPPRAFEFSIAFGIFFAIISLIKNSCPVTSKYHKYLIYLPNGVAVGIGIYNTPNFTLARFIGGLAAYLWLKYNKHDDKIKMIIISSGLVLGEGLLSGFTMLLTSLNIKHF